MENGPKGLNRQFTDDDLRKAIGRNLKPADIAAEFGVTRQAVYKRIRQLEQSTTTAAVAPKESQRFVSRQIDAMEQLARGLGKVNLLMDACDEWLRDADDPDAYNIGPRADEVMVHFLVAVPKDDGTKIEKRKASLSTLLDAVESSPELTVGGEAFYMLSGHEAKYADPRELILKTVQEARQTVSAAADLAKMLADAKAMQEWRETVLAAIGRAAPDVREQIAAEVRSSLVLRGLLDGPALGDGGQVN